MVTVCRFGVTKYKLVLPAGLWKAYVVLDTFAPHWRNVWGVFHLVWVANFVKWSYPHWNVVPDVCQAACGPERKLMIRWGDRIAEVLNLRCVYQVEPTSGIHQQFGSAGNAGNVGPSDPPLRCAHPTAHPVYTTRYVQ